MARSLEIVEAHPDIIRPWRIQTAALVEKGFESALDFVADPEDERKLPNFAIAVVDSRGNLVVLRTTDQRSPNLIQGAQVVAARTFATQSKSIPLQRLGAIPTPQEEWGVYDESDTPEGARLFSDVVKYGFRSGDYYFGFASSHFPNEPGFIPANDVFIHFMGVVNDMVGQEQVERGSPPVIDEDHQLFSS